ncbi:MAG: hypothetical protein ABIP76_02180 [Verrucomicrobiota bacterium]
MLGTVAKETSMTPSRKTNLPIATRICASMSLVVWLAAFLFCSGACCIGESQCDSGHEQHADASQHDHDPSPASDKHEHKASFCDSLKDVVQISGSDVFIKSDFGFINVDFVSQSHSSRIAALETPVFRQGWRRDWVSTPEVYLGPAFRSLAPPVLL